MTVKELINHLKEFDGKKEVVMPIDPEGNGFNSIWRVTESKSFVFIDPGCDIGDRVSEDFE